MTLSRAQKTFLRIDACGGAGDGKSTLIARLESESRALFGDQAAPPPGESRDPGALDYALLRDSLSPEGQQKSFVDVANHVFATEQRTFVVADTPGREKYTRNKVAGTSSADVGVILVDVRKGVSEQTRRQSFLVSLLGIRQVVLVVNKMDLVGHAQAAFTRIADEYRAFMAALGLPAVTCIPVSALQGDHVAQPSAAMPWYQGPTLLGLLDSFEAVESQLGGQPNHAAEVADQFEATVVWMSESPLLPGRDYLLRLGPQTATATIAPLKYKISVSNLHRLAAAKLDLNEIGVCNLQLDRSIAFDPYTVNRDTGGFVLVDRLSNDTVGAGILHFALRRAQNVHWQALDVNKAVRSASKGQKACVLWYTGLSGAGKTTIANLVDKKLHSMKRHTYLLDGDNIRHGLTKDLGFTDADRVENIRRIAEVAKLMVDAGLIVGTAFISPFRAERQTARALLAEGEFIEIFIDTPLGVAEQRDPKGLYKKARRGDLKNFTGIDSPYEGPQDPEIRIDTTRTSAEEAAQAIVTYLQQRGMLTFD
jgi:adenylyl-sulfate kinase